MAFSNPPYIIKVQDRNGKTALILAAGSGHVSAIELLLKAGAQVNTKRGGIGGSALHYAVTSGSKEAMKAFIDAKANLEILSSDSLTGFWMAAKRSRWEAAKLLLHAGAVLDSSDDGRSQMTPILCASKAGRSDVVRLLLEKGADPSDKCQCHGTTPLMFAILSGDLPTIEVLLGQSALIEAKSKGQGGTTALPMAASQGRADIVSLLLEAGRRSH